MEKIILDCDPGHDDAIAILLAAANPGIDLLGITTVAGNHTIENVTRNALAVCTAYGIQVPVARGAEGPLIGPQTLAKEIHGETGLDGPVLPPASSVDGRRVRRSRTSSDTVGCAISVAPRWSRSTSGTTWR